MSGLHDEWVRAMRNGEHARAWAIARQVLAGRPPRSRDDPALPYHLRWVWDGAPVDGRHVLVRCYHGLGDTIQFLRFLPLLRARAASVTLEIQPRLVPLLGSRPPADRVVPFDPARPLPPSECTLEVMDLSCALEAAPSTCPPPYLEVPPDPLPPGSIGLCGRAGDWDTGRSIPHALLAPLCEGRACIALDPGPSALPVRNPQGCPFDIVRTARIIAGLELVITVDTMVAHLAGALGRRTWLLLKHAPDWRWAPGRRESEWYPSMRLYAQPSPGDWRSVARSVAADLDAMFPSQRRSADEPRAAHPVRPGVLGRTSRQDHHPPDQA